MKPEQLEKIESLIRGWWLALNGGGGGGRSSGWLGSSFISGGTGGARCNIPALVGDVERTNRVMNALHQFERALLVEYYFVNEIAEEKARRHRMSERTYFRWVEKAREAFWMAWERMPFEAASIAPAQIAMPTLADICDPNFFDNAPWRKKNVAKPIKRRKRAKSRVSIPLETPRQ